MANQVSARAVQAQAYGAGSGGGIFTRLTAAGLVITGTVVTGAAVLTAAMPVDNEQLQMAMGAMDRLGLDKGPLALFGVVFIGLGMALTRLGKITGGSRDAKNAAAHSERTTGELESVGAIMATVQIEVNALRLEIGEVRREIQEARTEDTPQVGGGDTANDPMFRLAASLDQLGARVDKRIDGSRKEMLEAVREMSQTIQDVTQEQTEAAREQRAEFEGLRMDMADLHAEASRVDKGTIEAPATTPVQKGPAIERVATSAETAALPRELSDSAKAAEGRAAASPLAPLPSPPKAPAPAQEADETFDFASPPAPIPHPSEGLELLDKMEDGVVRETDSTPPLFPDLDNDSY